MSTSNSSPAFTGVSNWRDLYKAALIENDPHKVPSLIADAEIALILRARELLAMSGDPSEEGQAVDDALYALRALRSCMGLRTSGTNAA